MLRVALVFLVAAAVAPSIAMGESRGDARWSRAVGAPTYCVSQATDYEIASAIKQTWLAKTEEVFVDGRRQVRVLLSPRTCRLLRAKGLPQWVVIDAVFTLAHESVHVDGELNERIADCLGARRFDRVARVAGYRFSKRAVAAFFKGNACRR